MLFWYKKNFKIYTEGRGEEVWTLWSEQCQLSFAELLTVFQNYGVAPFEGLDKSNDYRIYKDEVFFYKLAFDSIDKCWTLQSGSDDSDGITLLDTPDYDYLRMLLLKLKIESETEDKTTTMKRTKI